VTTTAGDYADATEARPTPARGRTWSASPFFNELDVLEVKVREQMRWVDVFVFAESTVTYGGTPKPLLLQEALAPGGSLVDLAHDVSAAGSQIRVVTVEDDAPHAAPFQPFGDPRRWQRENHQRASLIRGMSDLEPNDVVCVSDLDEIVRGSLIRGYEEQGWDFITVPPLVMHVASLTHRWWAPIHVIARMCRGSALLPCGDPTYWTGHCGMTPEELRRMPGMRIEVPPGQDIAYYGWHLSYMGGTAAIDYKLREAAHPEMDAPSLRDEAHLAQVAAGEVDLFRRDGRPTVDAPPWTLPDVIQRDLAGWTKRLEGDVRGVYDPV
jgi:hypothetical protein